MNNFIELVEDVCERPGMYVGSEKFDAVAALFIGYDIATEALIGFREWLIVRLGGGSNLSWSGLVLMAALPDEKWGDRAALTDAHHRTSIKTLRTLLKEFIEERTRRGLRRIYLDYQSWLERQSWYGPDSLDWYEKP